MTITFETDNDVIVYALEKVISYARDQRYIFLAQSVWSISSILGLQEGLVIHIDNLKARANIRKSRSPEGLRQLSGIHPDRVANLQNSESAYNTSDGNLISTTETEIHNEVIRNSEAFLAQSKQERKNIRCFTRQASRVVTRRADRKAQKKAKKCIKTFGTQTKGIDGSELRRRKAAGVCQRCACPQERKGSHKTLDCYRGQRLEKGTAPIPGKKW